MDIKTCLFWNVCLAERSDKMDSKSWFTLPSEESEMVIIKIIY